MYPVFLNLKKRLAVVVGAGPVGGRKVAGLLAAGATVRVVCLEQAPIPGVEWITEPYRPEHLDGAALVFAAVNPEINAQVVADAQARGIWVCDAADGTRGDFHTPAVLRRGELVVAVGTGGKSPTVAVQLRDFIATQINSEWIYRLQEESKERGEIGEGK
jgi:precorrin-2 dehydrogenase/sirohydrochlorin ferrochelatase